jgi:uncharacterized membrane protein
MKDIKEDRQLKSFVKTGLLKQAPTGMVDRIMANIAVNPARRRLTVKAVEPKGFMATLMVSLMGALVIIAVFLQPASSFSFSIDQYVNIHINQVWVAPVVVGSIALWVYIIISNRQLSKT